MVDIHTHALPFIDDGSESLEKSIEMLKEEKAQGVTDVFLTPHFRTGEYEYSKQDVLDKFNKFLEEIEGIEGLPNIHLGQESFCDEGIYKRAEDKEIICLGDSKAVLLEFNYKDETDIADYVYNFSVLGYYPIIAHVERYRYIDKYMIIAIRQNGGFIQVNAAAVIGHMGKHVQTFVLKLIKEGLVDFISSDVHHDTTNHLKEAYDFIKKKFKNKVADALFINNATKYILD
ncbi:MAG: hypothetical protein IJW26_04925 [Clostridia bacterium]|nr:hypothetical protein [Clostridia bacterium]